MRIEKQETPRIDKKQSPSWRKKYIFVFITAYAISGGLLINEFINREQGMPMNAWYGFINSLIFGLGIIGFAVTEYVIGNEKKKLNIIFAIVFGLFFIGSGFFSLYYQINY